jgi:FkbM family methyltransferase
LAKAFEHRRLKRSHELLLALRWLWKDALPIYSLSSNVKIAVPIGRREHCWDLRDVLSYEERLVESFCLAVGSMADVTLIDCGADIGLFSALVCARVNTVCCVLAFEPNQEIEEILKRNISGLPHGTTFMSAVSDFVGSGKLEQPDYDPSDHARYLSPAEAGVPVVTIDSLNLVIRDLAIKVDVEGSEINVIRGARETIRRAANCVVTIEDHPSVRKRTGIGPEECVCLLESIRPFKVVIAETGEAFDPGRSEGNPRVNRNLVAKTAKAS